MDGDGDSLSRTLVCLMEHLAPLNAEGWLLGMTVSTRTPLLLDPAHASNPHRPARQSLCLATGTTRC